MRSWTIHLPPLGRDDVPDTDRFALVKDGFAVLPIVFGPFWFAAKRYWWAALGVLTAQILLGVLVWAAGLPPIANSAMLAAFNLLLGFEASTLQIWSLRRAGWREVGSVVAHGKDEAELRAAMALEALGEAPDSPDGGVRRISRPSASWRSSPAPAPVLGLFPDGRAG